MRGDKSSIKVGIATGTGHKKETQAKQTAKGFGMKGFQSKSKVTTEREPSQMILDALKEVKLIDWKEGLSISHVRVKRLCLDLNLWLKRNLNYGLKNTLTFPDEDSFCYGVFYLSFSFKCTSAESLYYEESHP